jgi:hypothetical protein
VVEIHWKCREWDGEWRSWLQPRCPRVSRRWRLDYGFSPDSHFGLRRWFMRITLHQALVSLIVYRCNNGSVDCPCPPKIIYDDLINLCCRPILNSIHLEHSRDTVTPPIGLHSLHREQNWLLLIPRVKERSPTGVVAVNPWWIQLSIIFTAYGLHIIEYHITVIYNAVLRFAGTKAFLSNLVTWLHQNWYRIRSFGCLSIY